MKYDMNDLQTEEQKNKYVNEMMDSISDDYECYQKQKEERSTRRLAEEIRRIKRNRFIAIVTAAVLVIGTGAYVLKDKLIGTDTGGTADDSDIRYEDYIDYVNEQRELGFDVTISQEGYQEYVDSYGDVSKGSR